jgi:general secretion pathway protein M
MAMLGGGALLVILLLWALVWHPVSQGRAELAQRVDDQERLLSWMRAASSDVRQGRAQTMMSTDGATVSLLTLVDESLRAHELGDAVRRVEPDGDNVVRLWLDGARFDDLMAWFTTLDGGYGAVVNELSAQTTDAPGIVNVTLTLRW